MVIDQIDYAIVLDQSEASFTRTRVDAENAAREASRQAQLTNLETSDEQKQTFVSNAEAAEATCQQAAASLARASVDLQRTNIRSPVNGYVTNLLAQLGDYANVGRIKISIIDIDSFWVDGYFEETKLWTILPGEPSDIKLMGTAKSFMGTLTA
jgi:multidrug resistance efflux pump